MPLLFRVRSPLSLRRAIKLIDDMMAPLGLFEREVSEEELALPNAEEQRIEPKPLPIPKEAAMPVHEEPAALLPSEEEAEPIAEEPEPVAIEAEPEMEGFVLPEGEEDDESDVTGNAFAALASIKRQSFEEKFEKADEGIKDAYRQIKEEALKFGLRSRVSNFGDTFKLNGEHKGVYLKLNIVGKTLRAYFRLNPADFADSTIPFEDASDKKMFAETPFLLRVRSGLSLRRAIKLLDDMMNDVLGEESK